MVNEERVKQLYKIAVYEQNEEKEHRQAGQFYRSDYIGKEVVKSFFSGSIAYLIMLALWAINLSMKCLRDTSSFIAFILWN